jgi:hypothetical protein
MKKQELNELIRKEVIAAINEGKKKKKATFEGISVEGSGHVDMNEVGTFWVATGPQKGDLGEVKGKSKKKNYFETDIFNFTEKVQNGEITLETIKGIFKKEGSARRMSEKLIQERENAVLEAKRKAEDLKNRLSNIKNEVGEFKKSKVATEQALSSLQENKKKTFKK